MKKTVIMVWSKTDSGMHPNGCIKTYGLGDILRGTIFLYQMSVKFGFNFIVDIRPHPISQHLIVNKHSLMEYVDANMNNIKIINCDEPADKFHYIYNASLHISDPLLICTNMFCNENLSSDCKHFMKQLLTPNKNFSEYLNEKTRSYSILSSPYSIIHFRLGDSEFLTKNQTDGSTLNETVNILKKYAESTDILMTDSFRFKQYLVDNKIDVAMFNTRPLHVGEFLTVFTEVGDSFKETLYEFFTLSTASKIKTHSVYGWISGFVKFSSLIYDVPLTNLKILMPISVPKSISIAPVIPAPKPGQIITSSKSISIAPVIPAPKPGQIITSSKSISIAPVIPAPISHPNTVTKNALDHIVLVPTIKIKSHTHDSIKKPMPDKKHIHSNSPYRFASFVKF